MSGALEAAMISGQNLTAPNASSVPYPVPSRANPITLPSRWFSAMQLAMCA